MTIKKETERMIEQYLCKQVRLHNGITYKFTSPSQRGVPDRIIFYKGRMYLVELKSPQGRLNKSQLYCHRHLASQGFHVFVLYSKEDVDAWVGEHLA